jgi:hypothetical protein
MQRTKHNSVNRRNIGVCSYTACSKKCATLKRNHFLRSDLKRQAADTIHGFAVIEELTVSVTEIVTGGKRVLCYIPILLTTLPAFAAVV